MSEFITRAQILTVAEIEQVFTDLRRKQNASIGTRMNLVLFELAVCYGLRATEIALLRVRDIVLSSKRAELDTVTLKKHRRSHHPGRRPPGNRPRRQIPLEIAPAARADLEAWKAHRGTMQAPGDAPLLCTLSRAKSTPPTLRVAHTPIHDSLGRPAGHRHRFTTADDPTATGSLTGYLCQPGRRLSRVEVWRRFKTACRCLGPDRLRTVTTHTGRHTFASHALSRGIPPQVVCAWLGHSSLAVTTLYAHVVDDLAGIPRTVFDLPA